MIDELTVTASHTLPHNDELKAGRLTPEAANDEDSVTSSGLFSIVPVKLRKVTQCDGFHVLLVSELLVTTSGSFYVLVLFAHPHTEVFLY
jgi:hypothetical protein